MAEKKKASSSKKKDTKTPKKKETMRQSAAKSRANQDKPKRVRKAATAAAKPVGSLGSALTQEYHVFEQKDGGNFFTRSRSFVPKYFINSWRELRQVTWPGRKETWKLVLAVFIFAVAMGTFIAVLDYGLERVMRDLII